MKKTMVGFAVAAMVSMMATIPAFAGQWQSDANGWWWKNNDGSFPTNTWQWIDYDRIDIDAVIIVSYFR